MKRTCSICGAKHKAKGFCNDHYQNFKTTGSPYGKTGRRRRNSIADMLDIISKIIPNKNGCKIWPRGINSAGYGHFSIKDRSYNVSRLLFQITYPDNYKGFVIRHKCDVRSCCNIEHLEKGTQKDNIQDIKNRNRNLFGNKHRHCKLSEDQVMEIRRRYTKGNGVQLAKEFGVSQFTIYSIVKFVNWRHLS